MKPTVVSADVLFEDHRATLKWEWVAGLGASERRFDEVAVRAARSGADLVGYLNSSILTACRFSASAKSPT
jgi:HPr kinase/phosphorylase